MKIKSQRRNNVPVTSEVLAAAIERGSLRTMIDEVRRRVQENCSELPITIVVSSADDAPDSMNFTSRRIDGRDVLELLVSEISNDAFKMYALYADDYNQMQIAIEGVDPSGKYIRYGKQAFIKTP